MSVDDIVRRATRDAYGHALLELGEKRRNLIVLDADLSRSTRTEWFKQRYPDQFINVGIAEQNMIGLAAGLALAGFLPFATTYAIFIGRAYDQIRQAVAFGRTNVKIVATHAGLAASHDGGSHQGIEDLALMRVLPGMTVLSPADYAQAKAAVLAAAAHAGPVYIRLQKEPVPDIATAADDEAPFEIGRAYVMRPGRDVALIATGSLVQESLDAADQLALDGIDAEVINVSTIKPLDVDTLTAALGRCRRGVVAEEHSVVGGLFESVAAACASKLPCRLVPVAMADCFGDTGHWHELRAQFGLTAAAIAAAARRLMASPIY